MAEYELVTLDDGTEARQYAGDKPGELRNAKGQMLQPLDGAAPPITTVTSPGMLELRKLKRLQANDRGMTLNPDFDTPEDALEAMTAARVELACDSEAGHASNQAHKVVLDEYSGGKQASAPTVNVLISISDDIAARYLGESEWTEDE